MRELKDRKNTDQVRSIKFSWGNQRGIHEEEIIVGVYKRAERLKNNNSNKVIKARRYSRAGGRHFIPYVCCLII